MNHQIDITRTFGAEESRKLRFLAHAMLEGIGDDVFNRGKPNVLVVPKPDRYEIREFLETMFHKKLSRDPASGDSLLWCASNKECETALARKGARTVVFAMADDLPGNLQESLRSAYYQHPAALILVTERHPEELVRAGMWTAGLKSTCIRTYRWPGIHTRNRSDRERLFKAGVEIALEAFRQTHRPRTSGTIPTKLEIDKALYDLVASHRLTEADGAHAVLEWGRKCADLAIANGDQRLTSKHGAVALATPGEITRELALASVGCG